MPLPELAAAVPFNHVEAVTLVREVVDRVVDGELPGVPSAHVIRLSAAGVLSVEGPIAAGGSAVPRAAHLLETLLPRSDSQRRVPGALRLMVGRALGTLDLPPYPSLDSFGAALSRFAAIDPSLCLRKIVADRPEEQLVTRTVWPLLEHSPNHGAFALERPSEPPVAADVTIMPADRQHVTSTSLGRMDQMVQRRRWEPRRFVAVLTIPALLGIVTLPAVLKYSAAVRRQAQHRVRAPQAQSQPQRSRTPANREPRIANRGSEDPC